MIRRRPLTVYAAIACLLLWLAFPPLKAWPAVFFGMAMLNALALRKATLTRRDYVSIWTGSFLLWLLLLQGIRLAFWPLYAGWIALAFYCSLYILLWLYLSRQLIHVRRLPPIVVLPLTWMVCELARAYLITGFAACMLAHTLVEIPVAIQIADLFGSYCVSGMIVVSSYGLLIAVVTVADHFKLLKRFDIYRVACREIAIGTGFVKIQISIAIFLGIVWIGYGAMHADADRFFQKSARVFKAALIQENAPTIFEANPERSAASWRSYARRTIDTRFAHDDLDLIIWPESIFTTGDPLIILQPGWKLPKEFSNQEITTERAEQLAVDLRDNFETKLSYLQQSADPGQSKKSPKLLVGSDVLEVDSAKLSRLNAAVLYDGEKKEITYYAKRHLVMFGEYIPFASYLPFIYSSIGMAPASAGRSSEVFDFGDGYRLAPTICFENVLPQLVRRSIQEVAPERRPTVLVNLTNDGWFRGSSILDHHVACAVFACVENRRPMLIAANTGLSAWIDSSGNKKAVSKRLTGETIIATPSMDTRNSLWSTLGDLPLWLLTSLLLLEKGSGLFFKGVRSLYSKKA